MTFLLVMVLGAGGVSLALDPETARLLNTIVNFVTLAYLMRHRAEVRPQVKAIREKVNHLDSVLDNTQPGGHRKTDPPTRGISGERRRRTDHNGTH